MESQQLFGSFAPLPLKMPVMWSSLHAAPCEILPQPSTLLLVDTASIHVPKKNLVGNAAIFSGTKALYPYIPQCRMISGLSTSALFTLYPFHLYELRFQSLTGV